MTGSAVEPDSRAVQAVLTLAADRVRRCGAATLVLIDGPAGSGKTTLAGHLEGAASERQASCAVVHMDDLYPGWEGLRAGGETLTELLHALAAGEPASYRRYDWAADAFAERVPVPRADLLIVEGVGSVRTEHAALASVLVWVAEPDEAERLRRGLARDGLQAEPHWRRWMAQEEALFAEVGTRERADLLVDGEGRLVKASGPREGAAP